MTSATQTESSLRVGAVSPEVDPQAVPFDPGLPGLRKLFDSEWVWGTYCKRFGKPNETPDRLRLRHFSYSPGARAIVGYVAERRWGRWVAEDQFTFELIAGKRERLFRYPDDPYLPGLTHVASALEAHQLLPQYVRLHPQRLHVETVRYRPTTHAVLRQSARLRGRGTGEVTLYVRVMPPGRVGRLLTAGELAERSGFVLPRLVGCWPEGGVAWLANMPGETVRTLIREGRPPDPQQILDGLAPLWSAPMPGNASPPELAAGFRQTERVLSRVVPDGEGQRILRQTTEVLGPFTEEWRPSALAHNDFYDDQLILTPTGRIGVVDFEETGPGDPLLDIGNMLAHMRWMSRSSRASEAFDGYRRELRSAALERYRWEGWDERQLALREGFALFRLCSGPVRGLQRDWLQRVETGLALVAETLGGAP